MLQWYSDQSCAASMHDALKLYYRLRNIYGNALFSVYLNKKLIFQKNSRTVQQSINVWKQFMGHISVWLTFFWYSVQSALGGCIGGTHKIVRVQIHLSEHLWLQTFQWASSTSTDTGFQEYLKREVFGGFEPRSLEAIPSWLTTTEIKVWSEHSVQWWIRAMLKHHKCANKLCLNPNEFLCPQDVQIVWLAVELISGGNKSRG